ncbi:UNVERIFIED_CONTAM: hypothetical protein HDU68_006851 [Siphonaria sp. JEL0065]|nr:hypothetical protein HDU68_006851 [Siphonaria sp. JEL0065]
MINPTINVQQQLSTIMQHTRHSQAQIIQICRRMMTIPVIVRMPRVIVVVRTIALVMMPPRMVTTRQVVVVVVRPAVVQRVTTVFQSLGISQSIGTGMMQGVLGNWGAWSSGSCCIGESVSGGVFGGEISGGINGGEVSGGASGISSGEVSGGEISGSVSSSVPGGSGDISGGELSGVPGAEGDMTTENSIGKRDAQQVDPNDESTQIMIAQFLEAMAQAAPAAANLSSTDMSNWINNLATSNKQVPIALGAMASMVANAMMDSGVQSGAMLDGLVNMAIAKDAKMVQDTMMMDVPAETASTSVATPEKTDLLQHLQQRVGKRDSKQENQLLLQVVVHGRMQMQHRKQLFGAQDLWRR